MIPASAAANDPLITPPPPAQTHLHRQAGKSKNKRQIAGFGAMGLGGLAIGVGVSLACKGSENNLFNLSQGLAEASLITGGLLTLTGMFTLASLSPSERRWKVIRSIPDPDIRKREAVLALRELARVGRNRRFAGSALNAISAVALMIADEPDT